MRRCLIAGCGDVGTRLGLRLAAAGVEVHGITRASTLPAPLVTHHADLTAGRLSLPAMPAFDALVYLPAPVRRDEATYRALYLDGPARLLEALPVPPPRLVFVTSTAVYGEDAGEWVDESTTPDPGAWNGHVLWQAEQALRARAPGAVVLRLAGLYGPGREMLVARVRAGVAGSSGRWTNRIHVDDAAAAALHVLRLPAPEPLYVVADGHPATEAEVMQWLAGRLGLAPVAAQVEATSGRRVRTARLAASGFACAYPDFRAGYGAVLAAAALTRN